MTFSNDTKDAAVNRDKDKNGCIWCAECERGPLISVPAYQARNPHARVFDHIVSQRNGGTDNLNNCRVICIDCNLAKALREDEIVYPLIVNGKVREGEEDAIRWMSASVYDRILMESQLEYIPWKGMRKKSHSLLDFCN